MVIVPAGIVTEVPRGLKNWNRMEDPVFQKFIIAPPWFPSNEGTAAGHIYWSMEPPASVLVKPYSAPTPIEAIVSPGYEMVNSSSSGVSSREARNPPGSAVPFVQTLKRNFPSAASSANMMSPLVQLRP